MKDAETHQETMSEPTVQAGGASHAVTRIISNAGFDALKPVWDALLADSDIDTIFLSHQWLRSWWAAFGGPRELAILVVRASERVIGIAPLMVETGSFLGIRARTVRFIGSPDADYGDFIGQDKGVICRQVFNFLMSNRRDWSKVQFEQIYEGSSTLKELRALFSNSDEVTEIEESDKCLRFMFTGTPEERAAFSIRRSHDLKRCANYFKGAGGFDVRRILGPAEIRRHLKLMYLLHWQRWQETPTPSKFADPSFRQMYEELVTRYENTPAICLMASYCGETPVTLSFNFEYKGSIAHYTLAYNSYYAKKSPGTLHVIQQTEQFVHQGFQLDFARGAGPYKKLVADDEYCNFRATMYGRSWEKQFADVYRAAKRSSPGQRLMANRQVMELKARLAHDLRVKGIGQVLRESARRILSSAVRVEQTLLCAFDLETTMAPPADTQCVRVTVENFPIFAMLRGILLDSPEMKTYLSDLAQGTELFCLTDDAIPIASVRAAQQTNSSSNREPIHRELSDLFISPFMPDPAQLRYFLTEVSRSSQADPARPVLTVTPQLWREHHVMLISAGIRIVSRKTRFRFFSPTH